MVEGSDSEKVWERVSGVNEPFESEGSEQNGKEIGDRSQSEPKGIDGFQEFIKFVKWNLRKKDENDNNSDEDGYKNALQLSLTWEQKEFQAVREIF